MAGENLDFTDMDAIKVKVDKQGQETIENVPAAAMILVTLSRSSPSRVRRGARTCSVPRPVIDSANFIKALGAEE